MTTWDASAVICHKIPLWPEKVNASLKLPPGEEENHSLKEMGSTHDSPGVLHTGSRTLIVTCYLGNADVPSPQAWSNRLRSGSGIREWKFENLAREKLGNSFHETETMKTEVPYFLTPLNGYQASDPFHSEGK